MVSLDRPRAYADDLHGLRLRSGVGLAILLGSGLVITWISGATRARGWRRIRAVGVAVSAPLALAAGILAALY